MSSEEWRLVPGLHQDSSSRSQKGLCCSKHAESLEMKNDIWLSLVSFILFLTRDSEFTGDPADPELGCNE